MAGARAGRAASQQNVHGPRLVHADRHEKRHRARTQPARCNATVPMLHAPAAARAHAALQTSAATVAHQSPGTGAQARPLLAARHPVTHAALTQLVEYLQHGALAAYQVRDPLFTLGSLALPRLLWSSGPDSRDDALPTTFQKTHMSASGSFLHAGER